MARNSAKGFQAWPLIMAGSWLLAIAISATSVFAQSADNSIMQMNAQEESLFIKGQYSQALEVGTKSLMLARNSLGGQSPVTADCFNNVAQIYEKLGDYTNAEASFTECLKIRETVLGMENPRTAQVMDDLGTLYTDMGQYTKAEPLLQQALTINEKTSGLDSVAMARSLSSMGNLYAALGEYSKAEDCDNQTLAINEAQGGTNNPNTAVAMHNLAELEIEMGDMSKAEPLLQQALKIDERLRGENHPDVGMELQALGSLYLQIGDYARAESYYDRSRDILENSEGANSPSTAATLCGLAMLYMNLGDYEKAEPLIARTLTIDVKALGTNTPVVNGLLGTIASLYAQAGNFSAAEKLDGRVLKIDQDAIGPESPATAAALLNLGSVYYLKGDCSKAEAYDEEAEAIQEKVLGLEHPDLAVCFQALAKVHAKRGDYTQAATLQEKAVDIDENVLGLANPSTGNLLAKMSEYELELQKTNEALRYAQKTEQSRLATLNNVLSFTSEQQRLNYESQIDPYALFASLNDTPDLALAVLRHKGVVLDSLLEDQVVARASADPDYQALVEKLEPAKRQLTQLTMAVPKSFSVETLTNRFNEYEKLSDQVDELEGTLARDVSGFGQVRRALGVTVAQVQQAIPSQGVLIEYITYKQYIGRGKFEEHYGAVVYSNAGDPKWIALGTVSDINKNVLNCQEAIGSNQEGKLSRALHKLYSQVWEPLETTFPAGTQIVIVSPGGALNFLSFATLLAGDDRFLAEKYSLRYVASGRDLLYQPVAALNQNMLIFAAPDYYTGGMVNWQSSMQLDPLPYSQTDAMNLAEQFKQWGWNVGVYVGAGATEQAVHAIQSPRILQFSTHGFVLPALIRGPEKYSLLGFPLDSETPVGVILRNPMSRSCIALAGAQVTLDAWQRGEVPPTENDGVLTAEEVGGLDLQGTWLVVLSACDTGIGELYSGEGVMGLRRGFIQAGAQNLLMTLWPIYDMSSSEIIKDFYAKLHDDNNPPEALAEVQKDWMLKLRAKNGLLSAVVLAGPFIVSSQGPVE